MQIPKLSIIVPVYNEKAQLQSFLEALVAQQGLDFELIICDGGSTDGTVADARRLAADYPFRTDVIDCVKGRGSQMNAGAGRAAAEMLLFLHVDSLFADSKALQKGWSALRSAQQNSEKDLAGHFALKFNRQDDSYPELYYHMECKARLNRKECTHGDQGFMLTRSFFSQLGVFDNHYPIAEDTRFAERVRAQGAWLLFPEVIATSARRFEVEGIRERQTFSSLLMNFVAMGWKEFFAEAANIYQIQDRTGRLQLLPYLQLIRKLTGKMPFRQRIGFWYATGRYVRDNAWQIPFYFDTSYQYRANISPGTGVNRRLKIHDQWIEPLLDHPPGRVAAGLLTWVWYRMTYFRLAKSLKK
jgi:rSAM/selenodomain-associated transferase 2